VDASNCIALKMLPEKNLFMIELTKGSYIFGGYAEVEADEYHAIFAGFKWSFAD